MTIAVTDLRFEHHPTGLGVPTARPRISWRFGPSPPTCPNWRQTRYDVQVRRRRRGRGRGHGADADAEPGGENQGADDDGYAPLATYSIQGPRGRNNTFTPWVGDDLASRQCVDVRVGVYGTGGGSSDDAAAARNECDWSEWSTVEAALLHEDDLVAEFIQAPASVVAAEAERRVAERRDLDQWEVLGRRPDDDSGKKPEPQVPDPMRPIRFRKRFTLPATSAPPIRARLYVTALGVYEAYLNGHRVGDSFLAPGWQAYHSRLEYQVFDVGPLLRRGGEQNVLAIEVAEGWYAGRLVDKIHIYGDSLAAWAQLEVISREGDDPAGRTVVPTDSSWECAPSPILKSGIYDGEEYDMRLDEPGWLVAAASTAAASVSAAAASGSATTAPAGSRSLPWERVCVVKSQLPARLVASGSAPVRVTETIRPVAILRSPSGRVILDFGQNMAGKVRIVGRAQFAPGHRVRFRHAEVLENGELAMRILRTAKATDTIIFADRPLDDWSPHFTFHGFRYVEVSGWTPDDPFCPLGLDSIEALVTHTDMRRTGFFLCSDSDLNQLHSNAVWSMRGNFLSLPTDCPQRDERLGWTGDIQAFCPTGNFLYDCAGLLAGWLEDLSHDQRANGGVVPVVVPNALRGRDELASAQSVWGDAAVMVPWELYRWFGDERVLADSWDAIETHLASIPRGADGLWDDTKWQFADWLDPTAPPDNPGAARTDPTLVADAYLVHVTELASRIAAVIDRLDDSERHGADAARHRQTFLDKYTTKAGLVVSDSQTGLALAEVFGLYVDEAAHRGLSSRLGRVMEKAQFRIGTGFAGTPHLLHALTRAGLPDLAYRTLMQDQCPGWLYPVRRGATTIWERWDSMRPDGTINTSEMTSFNHYAYGSVASWLHASVGGIALEEPAWRRFRVTPVPGGGITWAEIGFEAPTGMIKCRWELEDGDGGEKGERGENVEKGERGEKGEPRRHPRRRQVRVKLTVPPNSVAVVTPTDRSDEFQVGSGEHEFVWGCRTGPAESEGEGLGN